MGGQTPKFACVIPLDDELKVKYWVAVAVVIIGALSSCGALIVIRISEL